jgi:plastocyanin
VSFAPVITNGGDMSRHKIVSRILPAFAAIALVVLFAAACDENSTTPVSPTTDFTDVGASPSTVVTPPPSPAGSESPSSSASAGPSSSAATTIDITAKDTSFDKKTITVPAGQKITVKFTNDDSIIHNFAVYDKKDGNELFTGQLFKGPNVTKTETFDAPEKPGDYYFQCDVHPEQMNGTLVVQ